MLRDVFVSYSQPDRDCAFELVAHLEARGISVWIAPRDVSPSADWAAEIIDALSAVRIMVLVFSANSNTSPQVRREVERAVHKQLRILPFRIEDVLPSKSLEYFLSSQHWLDAFPPPRTAHYDRLCAVLHEAFGAQVAALSPLPPRAPAGPAEPTPTDMLARPVDTARLHQVETELARYIGPVAKHFVQRAAAGAGDLEHLVLQLAPELDSETDRRQFIEACRQLSRSWG